MGGGAGGWYKESGNTSRRGNSVPLIISAPMGLLDLNGQFSMAAVSDRLHYKRI